MLQGKPRLSGARAALEALGVPEAERQAVIYAENKQKCLEELNSCWERRCLPRRSPLCSGDQLARVADSGRIILEKRQPNDAANSRRFRPILLDFFSANVCGRDLRQGKPNPAIFLLAATEMRVAPAHCFVVEDAPAGIEAARAGQHDGAWRRPT